MLLGVDYTVERLIKAYIERNEASMLMWFTRLESFGIDKYTALEIAMNELSEYINKNYVRKCDE